MFKTETCSKCGASYVIENPKHGRLCNPCYKEISELKLEDLTMRSIEDEIMARRFAIDDKEVTKNGRNK